MEAVGTGSAGMGSAGAGLADVLRARTRELHVQAERSGIVAEILRGRACRYGYALFLRNLVPVYAHLEEGLELHRTAPGIAAVAERAVYRSSALESDLAELWESPWREALPLLPSGARYGQRVREAARGDGSRLVAHAYARYLGDLNGGRILRRILSRSLGLGPGALSFYVYPGIADLDEFRTAYRATLDDAAAFVDPAAVVEEALAAFRLTIDVSEEVRRAAACRRAADRASMA